MGRKKKELSQLDIDASNAIKAGMSYGKYMAMKPKTDAPAPKKKSRVEYRHTCPICGNDFVTYNRKLKKYCSDECRCRAWEIQRRKSNKYPKPRVCATCGKEFMATNWRNQYCSEPCADEAHRQKMRAYIANRRAEEAKSNG